MIRLDHHTLAIDHHDLGSLPASASLLEQLCLPCQTAHSSVDFSRILRERHLASLRACCDCIAMSGLGDEASRYVAASANMLPFFSSVVQAAHDDPRALWSAFSMIIVSRKGAL